MAAFLGEQAAGSSPSGSLAPSDASPSSSLTAAAAALSILLRSSSSSSDGIIDERMHRKLPSLARHRKQGKPKGF